MSPPNPMLARVLKNPGDDQVRLSYAEALDEACDPLGEFIRVQIKLARLPANHTCALELETRQRELLAEFERDWVGELSDLVCWWNFRRGFVEEIAVTSDRFLQHGARLFELAPIRTVHFHRLNQSLEPLCESSFLRRAAFVDLSSNDIHDDGARLLANSPGLSWTHGLNLSSSGIGDDGLMALAQSPHLLGLRELYLCDNPITQEGLLAFAESPLAQRLQCVYARTSE